MVELGLLLDFFGGSAMIYPSLPHDIFFCIHARNMHANTKKKSPIAGHLRNLAEVHGNRTHLGPPSQPHTGFEVREPHQ
jgi:hypothetical protein